MEDDDWRNCSAMTESAVAEASSADPCQIQWQETNRCFYQTLNQIRVQQGVPPVKHHSDPIGNLLNDRTIFVKIRNESYPISCEILDSIFSGFGIIIGIGRLSSGFHSTVRFVEKESTIRAFKSLNGRYIYDDCCILDLFLVTSIESSPSNQDSTAFEETEGASPVVENYKEWEAKEIFEPEQEPEIEGSSWSKGGPELSVDMPKVDEFELEQLGRRAPTRHQETPTEVLEAIITNEFSSEIEGVGHVTNFAKVTFNPLNRCDNEIASPESVGIDETTCANHENFNGMKIALTDFRMVAIECLGISVAHKVFVEMSGSVESSIAIVASMVKSRVQEGHSVFDPGIASLCSILNRSQSPQISHGSCVSKISDFYMDATDKRSSLVVVAAVDIHRLVDGYKVFDPGISFVFNPRGGCDVQDVEERVPITLVVNPGGISLPLQTGYGRK